MGRVVIAAFRPNAGREAELLDLVQQHRAVLAGQGLVTDRPSLILRAQDGSLVEVFEWRSAQAIEDAHRNAAVQALWQRFEAVCRYVPLASLAEAAHPFAEFEPCGPDAC